MGIRGFRAAALAGALALAAVTGMLSPAGASPVVDYPTWDDVQNARGNEAATSATIARIDAALSGLQAEAARLGDAAVARGAEADAARAALVRATAEAAHLGRRSDDAVDAARLSADHAAQLAAALYRSGGTDLTGRLLLTSDRDSEGLLYRLATLDRVGGRLDIALQRAESDRNLAAALSEQADSARTARDGLATQAQTALDAAAAAAAAADAAVASEQASLDQLYAELATLKDTTAVLEQQYRAGQQQSNDPGSSGEGTSGGDGFSVPGNEVNDVAAARAFAYGQLAGWGMGTDQQNCLLLLWNRESGWRTNAYNASSGAYGIPQSLPGSKMSVIAADWRTNYRTQVTWGLSYIVGRYSTPCGAWAHSESVGWY